MLKAFQVQQNKTNLTPTEKPLKYTLSTSSLYGTDVVVEENRQLIDSIGRHVVFGTDFVFRFLNQSYSYFLK